MRTFFKSSDGWLFSTLMCLDKRKLNLSALISVGDTLNHSIFTLDQINGGLSRLESEGFIAFKGNRMFLTTKGKQFHKTHKKRFELCIPQQIRYSEIFSKTPLNEKEVVKEFFTLHEYTAALPKD